jgi:hypothetical protein
MTGLPGETEDDLSEIPHMTEKIVEKYYFLPKNIMKKGI